MIPEIPEQRRPESEPEEPRLTSKGLPVVSRNTIASIMSSQKEEDEWKAHLYEVKMRLLKENPMLAVFVREQVTQLHPAMTEQLLNIVANTLAAFEHQAEVDRKYHNPDPPDEPHFKTF